MNTLNENEIINEILLFLGDENINFIKAKTGNKKHSCLIYTSKVGFAGRYIRNHIREKFPHIDIIFKEQYGDNWYSQFEDWLHKIIEKVIYDRT